MLRPGNRLAAAGLAACLALAAGSARADIRIAVAGPLTGPLGDLGLGVAAGAQAAVDALNSGGGLLGQHIELLTEDDGCDEDRATAAANRIAAAGAVFVVGHLCSLPAIAAARIYAAEDIVDIAPGAPDPAFTDDRAGPGIFRLYGRADQEAPTAAAYLAAHFATTPIAVFDDDTSYGSGLADAVRAALAAAGVEPALVDTFSRSNPQTDDLLDRLAFRQIGVLFVGAYPDELGVLAQAIAARGLPVTLMAGDAAADPAFLAGAGAAADGTLFAFQPDPRDNPAATPAATAIRAAGAEPDGMTLYAYAAVEVWAAAVATAGSTDFGAVSAAIAAGSFDTALGTVAFDPSGNLLLPGWIVDRWQGGAYAPAP